MIEDAARNLLIDLTARIDITKVRIPPTITAAEIEALCTKHNAHCVIDSWGIALYPNEEREWIPAMLRRQAD